MNTTYDLSVREVLTLAGVLGHDPRGIVYELSGLGLKTQKLDDEDIKELFKTTFYPLDTLRRAFGRNLLWEE